MRIAKQTDSKLIIKGDKKRIKRNIAYGCIIIALFVVPSLVFLLRNYIDLENISYLLRAIAFPILALIGVATVLLRENTRIVIDKDDNTISAKLPFNKEAKLYSLHSAIEVQLKHHGNPYYFPKLEIK
jgi:hypothetical protein